MFGSTSYNLLYRFSGEAWTIHPLNPMQKEQLYQQIGTVLAIWPECEVLIEPEGGHSFEEGSDSDMKTIDKH